MRDIRFKFWNKEANRFEYDHLLSRSAYQNPFERSDLIACQFTGLYDCKDVPIYEGDIIAGERDPSDKWVIEWPETDAGFRMIYVAVYSAIRAALFDEEANKRKVIGNRYQNPELIISENKV